MEHLKEICLAGGCFWGTQAYMKLLPGVVDTQVGYANSNVEHPSYEEVCTGGTGAAEAVLVTYDPHVISFELLLEAFFRTIDPTLVNRQGNDIGTQYRSGIYWIDEADVSAIRAVLMREQERYERPLAVEVMHLESFAPAEAYHQDYLDKNPFGYCHVDLRDAKRFVAEHMGPDHSLDAD